MAYPNPVLRMFAYGQSNLTAQPSYSDPADPPDHSRLTDTRIKVWDDSAEEWVVGDSAHASGLHGAGGTGLLYPEIALNAFANGATDTYLLSIAEPAKDVHQMAPSSNELIFDGNTVNRWDKGIEHARQAGLEAEYLIGHIGEGNGSTILTQAMIKGYHDEIIDAALAEWPSSLRRVVLAIPSMRLDLPAGTQSTRGHVVRAIRAIEVERAGLVKVVDLAEWHLRSYPSQYPHNNTSEYAAQAVLFEAALRAT